MAKDNEGKWKRDVCQQIRACNGVVNYLQGSLRQEPGLPDTIIVHRLWGGLVEFKNVDTLIEPQQARKVRDYNERQPGFAYIVRRPNRVEDWEGELLATFDGTGRGLLRTLYALKSGRLDLLSGDWPV